MKRFEDYWTVTPELPEAGFKIYLLSKGLDAAENMLNAHAEAIEFLRKQIDSLTEKK